jgi:hypothetical protein
MNTARMHRAGVTQPRHYTHTNMNAGGWEVGVAACLYCRVFEGKVLSGSRAARISLGLLEKTIKLKGKR